MDWYVYILRCAPDTLYTGSTSDPVRRMRQHLSLAAGGAKYTRSHPPQSLEVLWTVPDAHAAHSLEWHIKRLPRDKKQQLIDAPDAVSALLGACAAEAVPVDRCRYQDYFPDLA